MSGRQKNFIIVVAMPERELSGAVLLGTKLAGGAHNVWLVEKNRFRKFPEFFPRSVVLEKGLTTGCLDRFKAMRRAGHVLSVMCQEGFTYRSGEDYNERRVWGDTVKAVDYLFLWGERQKNDLQRFLGDVRGYCVSGNPRFDLLQPAFSECWDAETRRIKEEHGDFILFTSRFGAVNHFRRDFEGTLDRRSAIYTGTALQNVPQRFEFLRNLFLDYMSAVEQMSKRFPDLAIVVRPHPLENPETWRAHFQDYANVQVRAGGSAIPWLKAARCVIHSACTTGIEAYILNRPVTEYYPAAIPRSDFDPVFPGKVTGCCESPQQLAQWIEANFRREGPDNRRASSDDLIAHYLQNWQAPNAYLDMATALENFRSPVQWPSVKAIVSRIRARRAPQNRYLNVDEVNGLVESYVKCNVRERFVPAVMDEVGVKLH
jgi:surface carbohydrate biosynthesis protein